MPSTEPAAARPGRPPAVAEDIGAALVAARRRGVPWKVLMRIYGLGRTALYERWRAANDAKAVG